MLETLFIRCCGLVMNENKIFESCTKGFNKPLILWILCIKPRYGYNLILEFKRITGRELKPSTVYPFLYILEKKSYIVGTWITINKRRVKNYEVTEKGKILLASVKEYLKPLSEIVLDLLYSDWGEVKNRIISNAKKEGLLLP